MGVYLFTWGGVPLGGGYPWVAGETVEIGLTLGGALGKAAELAALVVGQPEAVIAAAARGGVAPPLHDVWRLADAQIGRGGDPLLLHPVRRLDPRIEAAVDG